MGRDKDGNLHRAKVLSSTSIRGCNQSVGTYKLTVDFPTIYANNFFVGFRLLVPGQELDAKVLQSSLGTIEVKSPLPTSLKVGDLCVLQFEGEAPELGARVITQTPGNEKLTDSRLRIATTKGTNALLEKKGARTVLFLSLIHI